MKGGQQRKKETNKWVTTKDGNKGKKGTKQRRKQSKEGNKENMIQVYGSERNAEPKMINHVQCNRI